MGKENRMVEKKSDENYKALENVHSMNASGVHNNCYLILEIPEYAPISEEAGKSYILKANEVFRVRMYLDASDYDSDRGDIIDFPQRFTEAYELVSFNKDEGKAVGKPLSVDREFSDGLVDLVLLFGN